jgi:hypothetical protein
MKVINLFAGPGAGKSTTAAGLFFLMKLEGYNVELVTEAAKDFTWEEHNFALNEQYIISAEQNRRLSRLEGKVDFAITDSPLLLGLAYLRDDYVPLFPSFLIELHNSYDNFLNVWINRVKPFNPVGRNQDEAEAKYKDLKILDIMFQANLEYMFVDGNQKAPEKILAQLKSQL